MLSDLMKESLSLCLGPAENAFCLPPLAYTSSEALNLEKKNIFSPGYGKFIECFEPTISDVWHL